MSTSIQVDEGTSGTLPWREQWSKTGSCASLFFEINLHIMHEWESTLYIVCPRLFFFIATKVHPSSRKKYTRWFIYPYVQSKHVCSTWFANVSPRYDINSLRKAHRQGLGDLRVPLCPSLLWHLPNVCFRAKRQPKGHFRKRIWH